MSTTSTITTSKAAHSTVVILDYGSQYTQLITRRVRELGIYSIILPGDSTLERIQTFKPAAVILSGGPSSVFDEGAPELPKGFLAEQEKNKLPVLGICYGMQILARDLGGAVSRAKTREYGRMEVIGDCGKKFQAWMSHGDSVEKLPPGFECVSRTASGVMASMFHDDRRIAALQFHPEVTHTENGIQFLKDFLLDMAGIKPDWSMTSVIEDQIAKIQEQVGPNEHVICGLSGGVDSAVAAVLVHKAIGDRLHCVFVDHGLLRFDEKARVMKMFEDELKLPVQCVDASVRFLSKLKGVTDPEKKRKIIGAEFIAVFDEAAESVAKRVGLAAGKVPGFLVQGTLYPDVIESSPGHKHAVTIKSHHNVGGLPKDLKFKLIEPLRDLFKDEVREMGRKLGVPEVFVERHPFPGPGLAVRIIGEITDENLKILRQVDEVFIGSLREAGLYNKIWQAFAVFLPIRSVGVQGDGRTHDYVVGLRAVTSSDGMTADWYAFEPKFLAHVSSKICNEVRGVNRVVYDISSKPPATIEWE
jgi:GMP synthase (glutamine-hydrolysing)